MIIIAELLGFYQTLLLFLGTTLLMSILDDLGVEIRKLRIEVRKLRGKDE